MKVGNNTKGDVPTIQNLPFDKNLSYANITLGLGFIQGVNLFIYLFRKR